MLLSRLNSSSGMMAGLLSYDNMHNFGGFIEDEVLLLMDILPQQYRSAVRAKLETITGKESTDGYFYFKFFNWRQISLNLSNIFIEYTLEHINGPLQTLFELNTEIHLYHYINFNRDGPQSKIVRLRYCFIIFMLTQQLRQLFFSKRCREVEYSFTYIRY